MGLISTEVEITLCSATIKHYEDLGYEIPRVFFKRKKKYVVSRGTKLLVKVEDLQKASNVKVEIECDCCKKQYTDTFNNYQKINHNGATYCKSCSKKLFFSGENHPLYNPNISDEERENGRNYPEYHNFIKRVLARDDYTCQCCKKQHEYLNVHHLDSYDWCKEKRTDDTNGITLCENCHKNFHSIYGYGNNTKEQFEEWLGYTLGEIKKYNRELTTARKIYCYEEDKVYSSAHEFANKWNIKYKRHIYEVCNHQKIIDKDGKVICTTKTVKGMHLFWYDEYVNLTHEEILSYTDTSIKRSSDKNVIWLDTLQVYPTIASASRASQISESAISRCCKHEQKNAICKSTGEKFQFMYYDEYLEIQKNCKTY